MIMWLVASLGAFALGILYLQRAQQQKIEKISSSLLGQAEAKAKVTIDTARLEAKEIILKAEHNAHLVQQECAKLERAVEAKDDMLSREKSSLQQKLVELQKKEKALLEREKLLSEQEAAFQASLQLSSQEAKAQIILHAQKESEKECQLYYLLERQKCEERIKEYAHKLVVTTLARLPHKALTDASICEIALPNEEMKAKIIGREGKNIKAFQQCTGVTLIVDETPETIVLSSFDVQRREIAKIALIELIRDGRITTDRIEQEVQLAEKKLDDRLLQYGQEAARVCHLHAIHPTLLVCLGRLKLQTSFGQNLLEHSVEVANIMGQIATELKLNVSTAMRMGLLHDIGKALHSDTPQSHALAGYRLCLECGESEEVANGVGCHHDEMPAGSLEAMLVKCADYLSGARPGARAENGEQFIKRLRDFEAEALRFSGVKSAFALSAGRELQVFVRPEVVSDAEALSLAKQIAQKIQALSPSMRVQISVIRESKMVEYT